MECLYSESEYSGVHFTYIYIYISHLWWGEYFAIRLGCRACNPATNSLQVNLCSAEMCFAGILVWIGFSKKPRYSHMPSTAELIIVYLWYVLRYTYLLCIIYQITNINTKEFDTMCLWYTHNTSTIYTQCTKQFEMSTNQWCLNDSLGSRNMHIFSHVFLSGKAWFSFLLS